MPIKIGTFRFLPTGLHGLCFGFCFAGLLPLRSQSDDPLFMVRFGESLVFRLYSEIDHIHLSSEAQCVSHLLPPGDCHINHFQSLPLSSGEARTKFWFICTKTFDQHCRMLKKVLTMYGIRAPFLTGFNLQNSFRFRMIYLHHEHIDDQDLWHRPCRPWHQSKLP